LKDEHRAGIAQGLDHLQPIFEGLVMHGPAAVSGIVHQNVERALGEKKLVGGVINLLAAKIPHIQTEGPALGIGKFMTVDVDPPRGFLLLGQGQIGAVQAAQQACLPHTAIPENQHLRFMQVINSLLVDFA
jgi:hypothetical protein